MLDESGATRIVATCAHCSNTLENEHPQLGGCRVMLGDSLTSKPADGSAGEGVEVVDVAQMLLAAVRRGDPAGEPASV